MYQFISDNNTAALNESTKSTSSNSLQTSRQILFIIGLFVSFVCITLFAIWIITRRRKLGKFETEQQHTHLEYSKLMSKC